MADSDNKAPAKASARLSDPDDPKSAPLRDFGTYADAVEQAKALGVDPGDIVAVGTAYHIPSEDE